jgi:general secretion pathway protein F
MKTFVYKATTYTGDLVKSDMEANTPDEVISHLHDRQLIPLTIKEKRKKGDIFDGFDLKFKLWGLSQKELLILTQELSTLLNAGLPLDRSLEILIDISENENTAAIVGDVLKVIEEGGSFSSALTESNPKFPDLYVSMVKAGEEGGVLPNVLQRLSEYIQDSIQLKSDVINTLIYPTILTLVGGFSLIFILIFVIPRFSVIFATMGASLPLTALYIIRTGRFLQDYWWALIGIAIALVLIFRLYISAPSGKMAWDKAKLKIPLFGAIIRKLEVGRFARTLGTMMKSGVPILPSLRIVKDTIQNQVIAHSVEDIAELLRKGEGIARPLKRTGIFPPLAVHLIEVGEETGKMEDMLFQIAEAFDRDVKLLIKRLISLLEPALILFMGVTIGFVVVSMLMAIFSINQVSF